MESDKLNEEILNNFSSRFIGTIGSEGTQHGGMLILEAMEKFDKDWPGKSHNEFMGELGCQNALELAQKLDKNKVDIYKDEMGFWRIILLRNEKNAHVLDLIDSAIRRKKCGVRKGHSENVIPLKFSDVHRAYERGKITFNEAVDIINGLNEVPKNAKNLGPKENIGQKPPPLIPLVIQEMIGNVKKLTLDQNINKNAHAGLYVELEEKLEAKGAQKGEKIKDEKERFEMEDEQNEEWKIDDDDEWDEEEKEEKLAEKEEKMGNGEGEMDKEENSPTLASHLYKQKASPKSNLLANQRNQIIAHLMGNQQNAVDKDHNISILRSENSELRKENGKLTNENKGLRAENRELVEQMENLLRILKIMPNFIGMRENKWNWQDRSANLVIPAENGLIMSSASPHGNRMETGRAKIPFLIDPNNKRPSIHCYFEVEILPGSSYYNILIGFCGSQFPLNDVGHIGLGSNSIGIWDKSGIEIDGANCPFGNGLNCSFRIGDVIGIGLGQLPRKNNSIGLTCFATLNGQFLGFVDLSSHFFGIEQIFPAASLEHSGDSIRANFGKETFLFDPIQLFH